MDMARKTIIVALAILAVACGSHGAGGGDESGTRVSFRVSTSYDGQPIPGAQVLLVILDQGLVPTGLTDGNGFIRISRAHLEQPGVVAIMFCSEGFFCGALRVGDDTTLKAEMELILLAPFAIL